MAGGQQEALDVMLAAIPVSRLGRPEEIANAVVFYALMWKALS